MTVVLEGRAMTDRTAAHDHLARRLGLPAWYGRNLDALYDLLTDMGAQTQIVLRDPACVAGNLGRYGEALLEVLREAAENNPNLTVTLE